MGKKINHAIGGSNKLMPKISELLCLQVSMLIQFYTIFMLEQTFSGNDFL